MHSLLLNTGGCYRVKFYEIMLMIFEMPLFLYSFSKFTAVTLVFKWDGLI